MLVNERVSVVVSLALIGLTLYFVLAFPVQAVTFTLFGTPLAVGSLQQLVALLLGILTMSGADAVVRLHPALPNRNPVYLATFWMLPGLLIILATQILGFAPDPATWAMGLTVIGLFLWLTIMAEFHQVSPADSKFRWSYLWRQLIGYGLAMAFFIIIYRTRTRSALSATGMMMIGGMVALALLRSRGELIAKTWLFAVVIGLSLGQLTWALNYWRINVLTGGLLLLLIFYVLIGLAQQQLWGQLSRRTIFEFGSIAAIALVIILNFT